MFAFDQDFPKADPVPRGCGDREPGGIFESVAALLVIDRQTSVIKEYSWSLDKDNLRIFF